MERIKGFIQITYSLVIGYGFFLTLVHADRRQLGRLFFVLCVALIVGCLLERTVEPFRNFSDAVRAKLYDAIMVYQSDQRDELLYGGIRPKLFTSEPSAVSFGFTLFSFGWLMIAPWRDWRLKLAVYFGMLGAAYIAMRGPTLMLGLVLVLPYIMMLEPWRARDAAPRDPGGSADRHRDPRRRARHRHHRGHELSVRGAPGGSIERIPIHRSSIASSGRSSSRST